MKLALVTLTLAALIGCAETRSATGPTAPPVQTPAPNPGSPPTSPPTPTASAWVWVMVVEESGICIDKATVRVIAGQQVGASATQVQDGSCNAWWFGGVMFRDLIPGQPMTLRVSAPGYLDVDVTVIPTTGGQQAVLVTPPRA
jgi:hypothetical protein